MELSACHRTGNHHIVTIIPTQVFRWGIIGLCAALVAHLPIGMSVAPLAAAATVMWLGDILTGPLLLSPVLQQGPVPVMRMMVREGGMAEAAQYLIGILGAMEAVHQPLALLLLVLPAGLIYMSFAKARHVDSETRRVLEDLADTVDRKDGFAADHSRRVAELSQELLHAIGKYGPEADLIVFAARVHDIGHIAIPDELLRKPGNLTPAETAILRTHVEKGEELLARYPDFSSGASVIRHHHESWDGTGYPDGLRGSAIPLGARVIAVADSFDAMMHDRPYRLRMAPGRAASLLRQGLGKQWDPDVVNALFRILGSEFEEPTGARLRLVPANEQDTG